MPATSPEQVQQAWNDNCTQTHFDVIPDPVPSADVIDEYNGQSFPRDCNTLYLLMQQEVKSSNHPPVNPGDTLESVLENPAWYN